MSIRPKCSPKYDDDYATCAETYLTLKIYTGLHPPSVATDILKIEPSKTVVASPNARPGLDRVNGWFLSSDHIIHSKDVRRHLDWLFAVLAPAEAGLKKLQEQVGLEMRVTCVWFSAAGHGGPTIRPDQMSKLSELNLELDFSFYFLPDK